MAGMIWVGPGKTPTEVAWVKERVSQNLEHLARTKTFKYTMTDVGDGFIVTFNNNAAIAMTIFKQEYATDNIPIIEEYHPTIKGHSVAAYLGEGKIDAHYLYGGYFNGHYIYAHLTVNQGEETIAGLEVYASSAIMLEDLLKILADVFNKEFDVEIPSEITKVKDPEKKNAWMVQSVEINEKYAKYSFYRSP
ncbi:hypothetical protein A3L09_10730 (plasmid) [Thermococcus profundus]|uniref:Uncharacterized protein n=1 Tax=Thermococcus profundus TaxID=49899 RepID=A0A2Z2MGH5_THEPR|nr:hypothetical protein [Thermococcus profundus]ASJ03825.1 hypothetical protein A3L09_10730 [Thermococcus profundus]